MSWHMNSTNATLKSIPSNATLTPHPAHTSILPLSPPQTPQSLAHPLTNLGSYLSSAQPLRTAPDSSPVSPADTASPCSAGADAGTTACWPTGAKPTALKRGFFFAGWVDTEMDCSSPESEPFEREVEEPVSRVSCFMSFSRCEINVSCRSVKYESGRFTNFSMLVVVRALVGFEIGHAGVAFLT